MIASSKLLSNQPFPLAWRCHTHYSSQNISLLPLLWAVSVGGVSTAHKKKSLFAQLDRHTTNQSNIVCCLLKTNSTQALFGDVVYYVTVDHLSIIKPALTIWLVRTALVRTQFFPNRATPDPTSRPKCFAWLAPRLHFPIFSVSRWYCFNRDSI